MTSLRIVNWFLASVAILISSLPRSLTCDTSCCLTAACFISPSFSQFHVFSTSRLHLGFCYHRTTLKSTATTCTACGWSSPNQRAESTWPSTTWAWRNSLTSCPLKMAAKQSRLFWVPFLGTCCRHPLLPAVTWHDWSFWRTTRTRIGDLTSPLQVCYKNMITFHFLW